MDEELLTVAAVARRLGVAPATLRTWDRRYGLGPSSHEAGEHRRYSPQDLAKLTMMRRLITTGVSPSDAAEKAKAHKGEITIESLLGNFEVREDLVESLYRAANALDKAFLASALRKDITQHGIISSWTEVIVPLLVTIGDDWEADGSGIEIEHVLSEILKKILLETVDSIEKPINARPVLLASVGEELHDLALHALAAALAEKKIETFFLGARTPFEAVSAMVKRSAPPAIFLWAQLTQNSDLQFIKELPVIRPAPRIIVGGPGWDPELCADVVVAQDLTHACAEIERAVGL
jgi:DNA-binding transcriptional MerR regulator